MCQYLYLCLYLSLCLGLFLHRRGRDLIAHVIDLVHPPAHQVAGTPHQALRTRAVPAVNMESEVPALDSIAATVWATLQVFRALVLFVFDDELLRQTAQPAFEATHNRTALTAR